ncbi:MAG: histone deacetylase [Chloroflexi bacterium]|nr:histone deacetylase [Chloroflexota bacterium]
MKVGLVYDPIYLDHDTGPHPENSGRLVETVSVLENSGVKERLVAIPAVKATPEELALVHSADHIKRVDAMAAAGGGWLDADTVVSPASYDVALYAAGGLLKATEAVIQGHVDSAFALVRPPGHHATQSRAMGFCLFNNIAVAAKEGLTKHKLDRVLIVDFDVHHGNATQDTFYHDPAVLYFSTHQYPFYPGSGSLHEVGAGTAQGATVNVPMPAYCGQEEYLRIFQEILVPAARRFQPQLILVSAGYDAHWADSISLMQLSVSTYAQFARTLKELAEELCRGKLVFTLEGGYHLQALAYSIKAMLEVLLGDTAIDDPLGEPTLARKPSGIEDLIQQVKGIHNLQ